MLIIRLANSDDAIDVLRWRNDAQTRAASWNVDLIDKATHIKWFNAAVKDQKRIFLMGELGDRKIGMVRFDACTEDIKAWKVSIMISPESRSQGIGASLLTHAISYFHSKLPGASLIAEVKNSNTASRHLFERLGFSITGLEGEKLEYKLSLYSHFNINCVDEKLKGQK